MKKEVGGIIAAGSLLAGAGLGFYETRQLIEHNARAEVAAADHDMVRLQMMHNRELLDLAALEMIAFCSGATAVGAIIHTHRQPF